MGFGQVRLQAGILLTQARHLAFGLVSWRSTPCAAQGLAALLLLAADAIPKSTTCTTPRVATERFDRHGHVVRIRRGSSACTGPKTPVALLAPEPRAVLARSPAQHADRPLRLSSTSRNAFPSCPPTH